MKIELKLFYKGVKQYQTVTDEWTIDFYEAINDIDVIDIAMRDLDAVVQFRSMDESQLWFELEFDGVLEGTKIPYSKKEFVYNLFNRGQSGYSELSIHGTKVNDCSQLIKSFLSTTSLFVSIEFHSGNNSFTIWDNNTQLKRYVFLWALAGTHLFTASGSQIPLLSLLGIKRVQDGIDNGIATAATEFQLNGATVNLHDLMDLIDFTQAKDEIPGACSNSVHGGFAGITPLFTTNLSQFEQLEDGYYIANHNGMPCIFYWSYKVLQNSVGEVTDDSDITDIQKLDIPVNMSVVLHIANKVNVKSDVLTTDSTIQPPSPIIRDDIMNITRDMCK